MKTAGRLLQSQQAGQSVAGIATTKMLPQTGLSVASTTGPSGIATVVSFLLHNIGFVFNHDSL